MTSRHLALTILIHALRGPPAGAGVLLPPGVTPTAAPPLRHRPA